MKGLDLERLNLPLRPGGWSIGQCLQHLAMTNEVYLPEVAQSLAGQSPSPVEDITLGGFTQWFINSFIEASPKATPAKAPRKITPEKEVDLSVLDRLLAGNQKLRSVILQASDYDVNNIRFKNPFIPFVRFTVGAGLEVVVRHQGRHLAQAEGRGLSR